MAILMLITENQENVPYNNIDDVVGVFSDSHLFSDWELARFNFVTVTGSRADVDARLNQIRPFTSRAFYSISADEYSFTEPVEEDRGLKIVVWSTLTPPVRWYQVNSPDKFIFKVGDLTQEEKDYISDPEFDINDSANDNYIKKFVKDLGRKPENNTEIRELRGTQP